MQSKVSPRSPQLDLEKIDAVIFDMDGVITDTAGAHAEAWKQMFDEYLEERAKRLNERFLPFDRDYDYQRYVDGKPRQEGVKAFLDSRGIRVPLGDPGDGPDMETAYGLGNRKNRIFVERLEKQGAVAYESSIRFIEQLKKKGIKVAVISSSKNAERVLEAAGARTFFEAKVDGIDMARAGLKGKPDPAIFLEAAKGLGVSPDRAAIVEDAIAGVEAGRNGGFRYVIGIDRSGGGKALQEWGANVVVADLSEIRLDHVREAEIVYRPVRDVPWAMERADDIFRQIWKGTFSLFFDYDGTLTPIVEHPDRAVLSPRMRGLLERLAERGTVAILSGRDLEDVKSKINLPNLIYAGSHGFDISGPGLRPMDDMGKRFLPALEEAAKRLEEIVKDVAGAWVERKRHALAVHFRQVDEEEDIKSLHKQVMELGERIPQLRVREGKRIFEFVPDISWDKGRALLSVLNSLHVDGREISPLYLGDDTTDEDAFAAIQKSGIGIVVGTDGRETAANFKLHDTNEVMGFLEKLLDLAEGRVVTSEWTLTYQDYNPDQERLRESLCTLGNGYFATRGAAPEEHAGRFHYPGTYIAGCYNRLVTEVAGHKIENEDLVNMPNWLYLTFRLEGCDWFKLQEVEILSYRQELDLRWGVLTRFICFRDRNQRQTRLTQRRLVSMHNPHLAALEVTIVAEDWSGKVDFHSALDGRVTNSGVDRYRQLANDHLETTDVGTEGENIIWLQVQTNQSHIRVAEAARTAVYSDGKPVPAERKLVSEPEYIAHELSLELKAGVPLTVEKTIALYTGRDFSVSESSLAARKDVTRAPGFDELLQRHALSWSHLWSRGNLMITHSERSSLVLNLHIFHLLQTVSPHTIHLDVGVPPRGLHGEAYRGHILWDELFIFPYLNLHIPDLTRSLLLYRYRRLAEARWQATQAGYSGAMYPWQSGSTGREESQVIHLNPLSGRWIPDNSSLQRHVNIAVAYNVWLYYQVTNDIEFLCFYGAEMMFEIARFWASVAAYNRSLDRYEIRGVMGPDEYHDAYPGAEEPGINNNAYTNVMAAWTLTNALGLLDILPEDRLGALREKLRLTREEIETWDDISHKLQVTFHDGGIISQFEGYGDLEEFDWQLYLERYGRIERLDRILEAEGDTPNRYKVSKQADVLMLFYLLSEEELGSIFNRLGYRLDHDAMLKNVDYYLMRTSHGSTLSRVVHSWVLARSQRELSWHLFKDALESDVGDIQGGTTAEGIHLGAMAGTVDIMQRCYTGLETRGGVLWLDPILPEDLKGLQFGMGYRRQWLKVEITQEQLRISAYRSNAPPIKIGFRDEVIELKPGDSREFRLEPAVAKVAVG